MKTASAYILYTPLSLSLFMDEVGGSLSQRKDGLTNTFDPDRSLFPLLLRPRLVVQDPDGIVAAGDHTTDLIDCRWYIGSDESGERITTATAGFSMGENGALTVSCNVHPSTPLNLFFSCAFIDPRTNKPFRKTFQTTLTSILGVELALQIEINAAKKMAVSPYLSDTLRSITATFRNGGEDIADEDAVYQWELLEDGVWRAIDDEDLFYISGQSTKTLEIDRAYIDKEFIRVVACHKNYPEKTVSAHTKIYRWYGQWDEREVIARGKFIRPNTKEIEARCIVDTPKGEVVSPENYFDITHIFTTNEKGAAQTVIGYGEAVVVPASIVGKDPNVIPVFGCEVKEKTALRACTVDGKVATINGMVMTMSIPNE